MQQREGLFAIPKYHEYLAVATDQKRVSGGARRLPLRPRVDVLFNLINRTFKGLMYGR